MVDLPSRCQEDHLDGGVDDGEGSIYWRVVIESEP